MKKVNLVEMLKEKGVTMDESETKLFTEVGNAFNLATEGSVSSEAMKTAIEDAIAKLPAAVAAKNVKVGEGEAAKSIEDILREQGTAIEDLRKGNAQTEDGPMTLKKQADIIGEVAKQVKAKKAAGAAGEFFVDSETVTKAPVNMTVGNTQGNAAGVTVPANFMYGVTGPSNPDPRIAPYITQYVDNGSTSQASFFYVDKLPTEGTMAITAEGALKPLLSVAMERRPSSAFKIAGRSKVTEEALDDVPGLQSMINGELRYSHDIAEQNAIYTHVSAFAPGFVAGSLAATTTAPTNYDAIRAAVYAIMIASKGRFVPNAVVVNAADAYAMGAAKDTTNQYVYPPFVYPDGTVVAGVRVIVTVDPTNIPAGTYLVGDWRRVHRLVYKPFTIRLGQGINMNATAANITSDFETNQYTILGESRLHLWHYKNDETAFIKATFAATKTAIATA